MYVVAPAQPARKIIPVLEASAADRLQDLGTFRSTESPRSLYYVLHGQVDMDRLDQSRLDFLSLDPRLH